MVLASKRTPLAFRAVFLIFMMYTAVVSALTLNLCSNSNLGTFQSTYQYNSIGYCLDNCRNAGYAVAILQSYSCWCSNSVPADTVDLSNCQVKCPSYDLEDCAQAGFYGYFLVGTPSSTISGSASSSDTNDSGNGEDNTEETPDPDTSTTVVTLTGTALITQTTQVTKTLEAASTTVIQSIIYLNVVVTYSTVVAVTPSTSSKPSTTSSSSFSSSLSSDSESDSSAKVKETTVYSIVTLNGTVPQTVQTQTLYVTALRNGASSPSDSSTGLDSDPTGESQHNTDPDSTNSPSTSSTSKSASFFDSKGKVAGTFTAVGLVILGLILGILYCCCCVGGARRSGGDLDSFTDEENQVSSDELSYNEKAVPVAIASALAKSPPSSPLNRDNLGKSLLSFFNGAVVSSPEVGRSLSKKKLMMDDSASNDAGSRDGIMFPISELDTGFDPQNMFMNNNPSYKSLNDQLDYSRKTLKIANPDS